MINLKTKLQSLFIDRTNSGLLQSFRYFFVGGFSFIVDSFVLFVLVKLGFYYLISASVAFLIGMGVNFSLSKRLIFTNSPGMTTPLGEFCVYGLIGIVGLALTELFLYLFTDVIGFFFLVSKVFSAVIVLEWNFLARKFLLYRQ